MTRGPLASRDVIRQLAVPAIGVIHAIVVGLLPLRSTPAPFTSASISALAASADLLVGAGLVAAGIFWIRLRPATAVGPLAVAASIAWFAPDWIGWDGGPASIRSAASVVAPLLGPILLHLVVVSSGGFRRRVIRSTVVAAYAVTMVVSVGRALVRNPFLDLDCFAPPRNCEANVFLLIPNQRIANVLEPAMLVVIAAVGLALTAVALRLLTLERRPSRQFRGLLLSGAAIGVTQAISAIQFLATHGETAADPTVAALFLWRCAAIGAFALASIWAAGCIVRIDMTVTHLVREIDSTARPGGLQAALAASLGDPGLQVAYRLQDSDRFVDRDGAPMDIRPGPGRAATSINRGGQAIALVVHDAGLGDVEALSRTIGSAARLAVDNERLQAESRAGLADLSSSRARIVETADRTRRGLERNLHDGAQQRVLALSYELRLGRAAAEREGRPDLVAAFDDAIDINQVVLDDLRELAHGIFPAVLAEAGLDPALADLADRSTVPLEIQGFGSGRCPATSETAAYVVIDDLVRSAGSRGATHVRIDLSRPSGWLAAKISDDGPRPLASSAHLSDRVGSVGGTLEFEAAGPGMIVRLAVPCG